MQVVTLTDYLPSPRFDGIPWTEAHIEEAVAAAGPWTEIEVIPLDPIDDDPTQPLERHFTTDQASDDPGLWYRVIFADASGATLQPTVPVQNVEQSARDSYAELDDLARVLKIRNPTVEQSEAMATVLAAAADEIDSYVGGAGVPFPAPYPALAVDVNLRRAAELWQLHEAPFGILGLGAESVPIATAQNSFAKYRHDLAPLKASWGIG